MLSAAHDQNYAVKHVHVHCVLAGALVQRLRSIALHSVAEANARLCDQLHDTWQRSANHWFTDITRRGSVENGRQSSVPVPNSASHGRGRFSWMYQARRHWKDWVTILVLLGLLTGGNRAAPGCTDPA